VLAFRRARSALAIPWLVLACAAIAAVIVATRSSHTAHSRPTNTARLAPDRIYSVIIRSEFQTTNDGATGAYTMHLENSGTLPITIFSAPIAFPAGMALIPAADGSAGKVVLSPGQVTPLTWAFRITDCRGIPEAEWPVRLSAYTVRSIPPASYVELRPPGRGSLSWQRTATESYCGTGR
jgi:hypothetical protein